MKADLWGNDTRWDHVTNKSQNKPVHEHTHWPSRKFARNYERLEREKDGFRLILADFACLFVSTDMHPIIGIILCKFLWCICDEDSRASRQYCRITFWYKSAVKSSILLPYCHFQNCLEKQITWKIPTSPQKTPENPTNLNVSLQRSHTTSSCNVENYTILYVHRCM